MSQAKLDEKEPTRLSRGPNRVDMICKNFDESEFKGFCALLGADYRAIPGGSYLGKALTFIWYLERRGQTSDLVELCKLAKPNLAWDTFVFSDEQLTQELADSRNNPPLQMKILLTTYFNYGELIGLASEYDLDLNNFPGSSSNYKSRGLAAWFTNKNRLDELLKKIKDLRPSVPVIQNLILDLSVPSDELQKMAENLRPSVSGIQTNVQREIEPASTDLSQALYEYFNEIELIEICFDGNLFYDDFPGSMENKTREIADYLYRIKRDQQSRQILSSFIIACNRMAPDINWSELVGINLTTEELASPLYRRGFYTAAIRQLMHSAIEKEVGFRNFCKEYFPDALTSISLEMSFREQIQEVINFAMRRERLEELLGIMRAVYPHQFEELGPYKITS